VSLQVRIHGRGGQGAVTAAELLSVSAFNGGMHAQAFPSFGSERTGAPVVAFCRVDDSPIRVREPVSEPDALVIQDPTLLHQVDVFAGLDDEGSVLINSNRSPADLGLEQLITEKPDVLLLTVPATELAREHLGRPLPNIAMLGGFAAMSAAVTLGALLAAIAERFSGSTAAGNEAAAEAAFRHVGAELGARARA
jgi:pyruvate ferredoxin oxidoreductase gamma subunit